ncbi:MAG: hypothetical protein MUP13_11040 [Thermoanaerobaculales bacterium]|nr:hypothetical protein [Thermoanaerobaculales bacterium]
MSALDHAAVCGTAALRELVFTLEGPGGIISMNCYPGLASICITWPAWQRLVDMGKIDEEQATVRRDTSCTMFSALHTSQWGVRATGDAQVNLVALEPAPEGETWPPF